MPDTSQAADVPVRRCFGEYKEITYAYHHHSR